MDTAKRRLILAVVAAVAVGLAGCGGNGSPTARTTAPSATASATPQWVPPATPVELAMYEYYDVGFEQSGFAYGHTHPGVTVDVKHEWSDDEEQYIKAVKHALAGKSVPDLVMMPANTMDEMLARPKDWADLAPLFGDTVNEYAPWTIAQARASSGQLIAMPYGVSGLAVCYRTDLFKAAGLPTERGEVSALWPTWEKFIATGVKYRNVTGRTMIDEVSESFRAMAEQAGDPLFVDGKGAFVGQKSKSVKNAWNTAIKMIDAKISAGLYQFTDEWNDALSGKKFAVALCSSWMLGYIQDSSGATYDGRWEIATLPGGGGGNYGGYWIGIPAKSKHHKEAADVIRWLTGVAAAPTMTGENTITLVPGHLPSLDHHDVTSRTNSYFHDAPVGTIFADSVRAMKPVTFGRRYEQMMDEFESWLGAVQLDYYTPTEAYGNAITGTRKVYG
jgi:cellobiose transport system substrate-binding protein